MWLEKEGCVLQRVTNVAHALSWHGSNITVADVGGRVQLHLLFRRVVIYAASEVYCDFEVETQLLQLIVTRCRRVRMHVRYSA